MFKQSNVCITGISGINSDLFFSESFPEMDGSAHQLICAPFPEFLNGPCFDILDTWH